MPVMHVISSSARPFLTADGTAAIFLVETRSWQASRLARALTTPTMLWNPGRAAAKTARSLLLNQPTSARKLPSQQRPHKTMPGTSTRKRKRGATAVAEDGDSALDAMEIFKRHFETQFAPLKETGKKRVKKEAKVEIEHEWEGLSDDDIGVEGSHAACKGLFRPLC